jgi:hypothetical protein
LPAPRCRAWKRGIRFACFCWYPVQILTQQALQRHPSAHTWPPRHLSNLSR